jgi:4-hydroxy-3-polyprenylbenzoate decarboxylase
MPKTISGRGACQEVVMKNPDLSKLPVLTCWPEDGGPFITLPIIHTKDPETGLRNVGLYRMQVFDKTMTGMHWHRHKVSAKHYNLYKKLGKIMPVAVAIGGDPSNAYCATAPLPEGVDEYMLAGFIRKKKVELVQCITQDVQVPADADIVIEGYVDPNEELIWEGPFGDHTGYYSLADYYPRFHVTAITHRKDAVYSTTIVGIPPQEDAWIGKATERIFIAPIRLTMLPELIDMVMPVEGVFHNLVIVKIAKEYPGHAQKVMNALWGAGQMMLNKILVVVDADVNIHNNMEVAQYAAKHVDPARDILFSQGPMDVLDHACTAFAYGGKMGIDATSKLPEELAGFKSTSSSGPIALDKAALQMAFPQIHAVNDMLLGLGIPMLFVSLHKTESGQIAAFTPTLFSHPAMKEIKLVAVLDHTIDISRMTDAVWRFANNLDPKRDHYPFRDAQGMTKMLFDGTRKTKELDGFERPWPNILVSDDDTIKQVDAMWDRLGVGPFIESPSLHYKPQMYGGGAVAN